ncbi:MAG: hypothetical protein ACTSRP_07330 [Candidatus Helarchaeota archaeon]
MRYETFKRKLKELKKEYPQKFLRLKIEKLKESEMILGKIYTNVERINIAIIPKGATEKKRFIIGHLIVKPIGNKSKIITYHFAQSIFKDIIIINYSNLKTFKDFYNIVEMIVKDQYGGRWGHLGSIIVEYLNRKKGSF